MIYLGVDGCRAGWFSVAIDDKGGFETKIFPDIESLFKEYGKDSFTILGVRHGLFHGERQRQKIEVPPMRR